LHTVIAGSFFINENVGKVKNVKKCVFNLKNAKKGQTFFSSMAEETPPSVGVSKCSMSAQTTVECLHFISPKHLVANRTLNDANKYSVCRGLLSFIIRILQNLQHKPYPCCRFDARKLAKILLTTWSSQRLFACVFSVNIYYHHDVIRSCIFSADHGS